MQMWTFGFDFDDTDKLSFETYKRKGCIHKKTKIMRTMHYIHSAFLRREKKYCVEHNKAQI